MLIMFSEDGNYIHVELMRTRGAKEYARAYEQGLTFFRERGICPTWMSLDNETNRVIAAISRECGVHIQYAPPGNHRANAAERAIQTWKDHFISVLSTVDPDFPMEAWDKLVPQAELTLNLLRASTLNPDISAWALLHGAFDYNRTPMAPAGTKVLVFETPLNRATWDPHGVRGFYVGPALSHYRCYDVYIPATKRVRTSDTLSWHPADVVMPGSSQTELLTAAVEGLHQAVTLIRQSPTHLATARQALQHLDANTLGTLRELHNIFTAPEGVTPPVVLDGHGGDTNLPLIVPSPILPPGLDISQPSDYYALPSPGLLAPADAQRVDTLSPDVPPSVVSVPSDAGASERVYPTPTAIARRRSRLATHPVAPTPTPRTTRSTTGHQPLLGRGHRVRVPKAYGAITRCATNLSYRQGIRHFLATSVDLDASGRPLRYESAVKGPDGHHWEAGQNAEWDRLVDTGCIVFQPAGALPPGRKASYHNPQPKLKVRASGDVEYRIRSTYGGDRGDYSGPTKAETADMVTLKILLNAVVSEPDGKFMTIDIRDFYLGTPMDEYEYMWAPTKHIPPATMAKYNLAGLVSNGRVLIEVRKGIYGLRQAGMLAQQRLLAHLATHGYHQAANTPCLISHETRDIKFVLVVDDFGIKYKSTDDVNHLIQCLEELYTLRVDWSGEQFVGFHIRHDRTHHTIALSMPQYIERAVKRFHIVDHADNPGEHVPVYRRQSGPDLPPQDTSVPASPAQAKRIQEIVGVVLYYARAVDPVLLTACSKVSSQQSRPTAKVVDAAARLLRFAAKRPTSTIVFHRSDMRLIIHSDASYLSESDARSRVGGMSYLGSHANPDLINGAIHCRSSILNCVVASAAEAEYGGLFTNGQDGEGQRNTLHDLGYPQESTLLVTDNSCASSVANSSCTQRKSKAMDMRWHWIRDRVRQHHFQVQWQPGHRNLADLFTKDHPTPHILALRPFYVVDQSSIAGYNIRRTLSQLPVPRKSPKHGSTVYTIVSTKNNAKAFHTSGVGQRVHYRRDATCHSH
jgi:hypothetical protein